MSDSENESRTNAVGRKRNVHGELRTPSCPTSRRSSKASSKESGEISSSSASESEHDETSNKPPRHSPNAAITISDDSESEDGEVSSSHADGASSSSSMDTSSSDDDSHSDSGSSTLSHGISKMTAEADDMVRLYSLSKADRDLQKRYFNLTSPPDALVYCLCCGERGHMRSTCPSRKCSHCGAYDSHASSACPQHRRCPLCRQRGHDAKTCQNRSYQGQNDECDVCGEAGHVEEACSRLWCFPTIAAPVPREKQIREWEMIKGCYSCGSSEHWGDDCRYIRRDDLNSVRTWSEKNAERFILRRGSLDDPPPVENGGDENEDDDPLAALESGLKEDDGEYVEAEDSEEEYEPPPPPPSRPWQMGLFDDARD